MTAPQGGAEAGEPGFDLAESQRLVASYERRSDNALYFDFFPSVNTAAVRLIEKLHQANAEIESLRSQLAAATDAGKREGFIQGALWRSQQQSVSGDSICKAADAWIRGER